MGDLPAPLPLLGIVLLTYRLILGKGFNTVGALWPPCMPCMSLEPEELTALGHLQHWHYQVFSQKPETGPEGRIWPLPDTWLGGPYAGGPWTQLNPPLAGGPANFRAWRSLLLNLTGRSGPKTIMGVFLEDPRAY